METSTPVFEAATAALALDDAPASLEIARVMPSGNHTLKSVPKTFAAKHKTRGTDEIAIARKRIEHELEQLNLAYLSRKAALLPVEAEAARRLDERYRRLKHNSASLRIALNGEQSVAPLDQKYARIDPSFMGMNNWSQKHQCAVPLFAAFSISEPVCNINVLAQWKPGEAPAIVYYYSSSPLIDAFADCQPLKQFALRCLAGKIDALPEPEVQTTATFHSTWERRVEVANCTLKAATRFSGAIPDDVRTIIREAKTEFDAIYLVAEVPTWDISVDVEIQKPAPIPPGDPLVIGVKHDIHWLLTAFDTTPSEDFVVSSFTNTKPATSAGKL